ncbi:MAG: GtrA family protein [Bacteroidaceae bacterium]|nr:GtrA family protein [Bacteroidaceae bacterium]
MAAFLARVFKDSSDNTLVQLFRYFFVGGLAFVVDYASLFVLTEYIGLSYLWSAAVAFLLGLAVNYLISNVWVFTRHRVENRWTEFAVFSLIGIIGLGFNELIMYAGSGLLHLHYMLSKLCSTAIVFFWNFFARKFILFSSHIDQ